MSKKGLGFLLGFFFGILGLLGLLSCDEKEEKSAFMTGWAIAFVVNIIFFVLILGMSMSINYYYF